MADVGLDADLVLDIRSALEQVRRVEAALNRATTGVVVQVTADARQVTAQVTGAVDAADSTVTVTGEAAGLTGDVTAAIDNADSSVVVTGDASALTGEVTDAVDAGDSLVVVTGDASQITGAVTGAVDAADTDVVLTADASGLQSAQAAAGGLDDALGAAVGSAGSLAAVLGGLGIAGVGAGLVSLVSAASDLEQSLGGTSAIFGEFSGVIDTFARGAAEAAGLTEESARTLTSNIGGLLQGFGFTQEEAARTSVVLAQLGADLAATFGGSPEDAVRALGGALRGEFDPLERFGVSLNITQANLKAVELGLADSTSNVSLNARAQASLALIMERSAQAQGQFGREVNTTAGQLERARAEFGNTAAAVGATLQPAVNELLAAVRADLIPALGELGTSLGPSLVSTVTALLPVFGTFSRLLVALEPVVSTFATVVEAIPAPLLQVIGTFLAFRAAAGPLGNIIQTIGFSLLRNLVVPAGAVSGAFGTVTASTGGFRQSLATMISGISPATAALVGLTIVFTGLAAEQARAKARAAELEAQQDSLQSSFQGTEGAIAGAVAGLEDMIRSGRDLVVTFANLNFDFDAEKVFTEAGLTAEQFFDLLRGGTADVQAFTSELAAQGGVAGNAGAALDQLAAQYETAAEAAVNAGVATEDWTQAQADQAIAQTRNADGTVNYTAALDVLTVAQQEAAAAEEAQTQALTEQQQALADLAATAPALTFALAGLTQEGTRNADVLAAFAIAADEAGLSGAELDAVVGQLGSTSGPALQAAISAVAGTINEVRDAGLGTLPTIQDMAGEFEGFSLTRFRDELQDGLDAIIGFQENLALIAEQGGPRLAAAAAQLGPQFAGAIADGLRDGQGDIAAQAEFALAAIEQEGLSTQALLTGTIGPGLATATGAMGTLASTAFGQSFTLDASGQITLLEGQVIGGRPGVRTRAQELGTDAAAGFEAGFTPSAQPGVDAARGEIVGGGPGVRTRAEELGAAGTSGFGSGFGPDPRPALATARAFVQQGGPAMAKAGQVLGRSAVDGFRLGVAPVSGVAAAAVSSAVARVTGVSGVASRAGFTVGSALGQGLLSGLDVWADDVARSAAAIVTSAAAAARAAALAQSPSRLFAAIGSDIGEGLALGIQTTADLSAQAAAAAVAGAATAAQGAVTGSGVPLATVAPSVAAAAVLGATAGPSTVEVNIAPGAIVIQGTGDPVRDGRAAGTAALDAINRGARQVGFTARTRG